MDLYLLPGLATDRRLFQRLRLPEGRVKLLEWPAFHPGMTLEALAGRLREQVQADRPHLLAGVSMGGMVAQELALLTQPRQVVLISSWTGPHEWPTHVRWAARLRPQVLITEGTMRITWPLKRYLLGGRPGEVDRLLYEMALSEGARKIRWGLDAILRWPGSRWQGPLVRIHGDADRITPLRFPVDHRIPGAGHVMVLDRADEVGRLLQRIHQQALANVHEASRPQVP